MRKLIAISVIFALVVGAVFAEASVGGQLQIGTTLLSSDSDADDINMGGMKGHEAKVRFSFGDGESGGQFGLGASGDWIPRTHIYGTPSGVGAWGFMYWRPAELFRIQVGNNPDGDFGTAQISGWGFTGEAKNSVAALSDYNETLYMLARNEAWYDGTGSAANVNMSFFFTESITMNVVLPLASSSEMSNTFAYTDVNFVIGIEDVGKATLTWKGTGGLEKDVDDESMGTIYASFFLNSLDAIDVDFGFAFGLPYEFGDAVKTKVSPGMAVGVGLTFNQDDFGFKLRVGAMLGGSEKVGDADAVKDGTLISVGILPSYKLDAFTFFFHAGLGMYIPDGDAKNVTDWFVNPYISMPAGNLRFFAGFQLSQEGVTDGAEPPIVWAIPFGFNCYF